VNNNRRFFWIILFILTSGCGPLESGVIDRGFFSVGGTNDPRLLIRVAGQRYASNRIVGTRTVLRRAIARSQKKADHFALAISYNLMGYIYYQHEKDAKEAENYFRKALLVADENGLTCEKTRAYIHLALSSQLIHDKEKACFYKNRAENLLHEIHTDKSQMKGYCENGGVYVDNIEDVTIMFAGLEKPGGPGIWCPPLTLNGRPKESMGSNPE